MIYFLKSTRGGLAYEEIYRYADPRGKIQLWYLTTVGAAVALYFLVTNWDTHTAKIDAFTQAGQFVQSKLPRIPGPRWHPNLVGGMLALMLRHQVA